MKDTRLSDSDIDQLLASYRTQRTALSDKLSVIKKKIKRLKAVQSKKTT